MVEPLVNESACLPKRMLPYVYGVTRRLHDRFEIEILDYMNK